MSEIDKILESEKKKTTVFGTKQTMRLLKNHSLSKIYLCSNYPIDVEDQIVSLAKEAKVEVQKLKHTNEELGTLCKKPFKVATIGILIKK